MWTATRRNRSRIPPAAPVLYHDGRFYVIYDYENNWTLAIWDIGYDDDSLLIPRPPARD